MIRITVELLPGGHEAGKRHLGTAEIWNDATGTETTGHYRFRLSMWGRPDSTWRSGIVRNFPRKRRGPWDLLFQALAVAVGSRNNATPLSLEEQE